MPDQMFYGLKKSLNKQEQDSKTFTEDVTKRTLKLNNLGKCFSKIMHVFLVFFFLTKILYFPFLSMRLSDTTELCSEMFTSTLEIKIKPRARGYNTILRMN